MRHQVTFPWLSAPAARLGRRRRGATSPVPRIAPAAVRIPDPRQSQMPLRFGSIATIGPQIFVHEGARQALERRLVAAFAGPVQLAVTDNRHRMITHTRARGTLRVRVHMMFLDAPDRVLDALVRYVVFGDRQASQLVGLYIQANNYRIRAVRPVPGPLRTRGRVHDLVKILGDVNERYFGSAVTDVLITWGRRTLPRDKKRRTIKLGSYSAIERLIRLHPALDNEWVPRYFVGYIVYHELLHHVIPAYHAGGRAVLHTPEFQRRERLYPHYERAIEWERKHIDRLLRST
jgi:hypothetical protein